MENEDISKSVEKKLRAFRESDAMREAFITVSNLPVSVAFDPPSAFNDHASKQTMLKLLIHKTPLQR